jgi:(p)ppGpp synthase/HD superfamily hydrolase
MKLVDKAIKFAVKKHEDQYRKSSGIPYITHCFEVMKQVSNYGVTDEDILAAAILHDTIEDCGVTHKELAAKFNQRVADIVLECSREGGDNVNKLQKYQFMESFSTKSTEAILIKIADRTCNVWDYTNTPGKQKYAAEYALQAYPLYQAFLSFKVEFDYDIYQNALKALEYMEQVIRTQSNIDIYWPNNDANVKAVVL